MDSDQQNIVAADEGADIDLELIASVKTGLNTFMVALKNVGLYPASNNIRRQAIENIRQWFETWFTDNEALHLVVEKDRFLFHGVEVLTDKPAEPTVVFPFFRDGVQWLEFHEGITSQEIESFVNLINTFRIIREDAADDLVTAMWEADFDFVKYETAGEFWEVDETIDIAAIKVNAEMGTQSNQPLQSGGGTSGIALRPLGQDFDKSNINKGGTGSSIKSIASLLSGQGNAASGSDGQAAFSISGPESDSADSGNVLGDGQANGGNGYDQGPGSGFLDALAPYLKGELEEGEGDIGGRSTSKGQGGHGQGTGRGSGIGLETDCQVPPSHGASLLEKIEKNMAEAQSRSDFWKFTSQEQELVGQLVAWEEQRNHTKDCLELCLILLMEPDNICDDESFLKFLTDEIKFALSGAKFLQVREFYEKIQALAVSGKPELTALFNELGRRVSSPEILGTMTDIWSAGAQSFDRDALENLQRFLLMLPPETVHVLVPMLVRITDPQVEKVLLLAVAVCCCRINANINDLIVTLKTQFLRELIHIFVSQHLPCPVPLMINLTTNVSPLVREMAAHALLNNNMDNIRHIFYLISDPEPSIRNFMFTQLGKERNPVAEQLLVNFLSENYTTKEIMDREQTFRCYRALGQCASSRTTSFLSGILFHKDWKSFLGIDGHYHRAGAALALMLMPREWGAGQLLDDAGRSRLRDIRQALKQAEEEL